MDIWQKVFGDIKACKVIGTIPDVDSLEEEFKQKLDYIGSSLHDMSDSELRLAKKYQIKADDLINSRPGSMAVSQKKIRMFTKYNRMYMNMIDNEIQTRID
ncbi:MAG: hypothetical protein K8823_238 [Cenarchaeum symbiont of Oopsacas minuta]|nr:hypothetical protein [Cenarchaeum symbiont of Oopsacas minuta]